MHACAFADFSRLCRPCIQLNFEVQQNLTKTRLVWWLSHPNDSFHQNVSVEQGDPWVPRLTLSVSFLTFFHLSRLLRFLIFSLLNSQKAAVNSSADFYCILSCAAVESDSDQFGLNTHIKSALINYNHLTRPLQLNKKFDLNSLA
jgi:hypothetical protein